MKTNIDDHQARQCSRGVVFSRCTYRNPLSGSAVDATSMAVKNYIHTLQRHRAARRSWSSSNDHTSFSKRASVMLTNAISLISSSLVLVRRIVVMKPVNYVDHRIRR